MGIVDTQQALKERAQSIDVAQQQVNSFNPNLEAVRTRAFLSSPGAMTANVKLGEVEQQRNLAKRSAQTQVQGYRQEQAGYEQQVQDYLKTDQGRIEFAQQSGVKAQPIYGEYHKGGGDVLLGYKYNTPYGEVTDYSPREAISKAENYRSSQSQAKELGYQSKSELVGQLGAKTGQVTTPSGAVIDLKTGTISSSALPVYPGGYSPVSYPGTLPGVTVVKNPFTVDSQVLNTSKPSNLNGNIGDLNLLSGVRSGVSVRTDTGQPNGFFSRIGSYFTGGAKAGLQAEERYYDPRLGGIVQAAPDTGGQGTVVLKVPLTNETAKVITPKQIITLQSDPNVKAVLSKDYITNPPPVIPQSLIGVDVNNLKISPASVRFDNTNGLGMSYDQQMAQLMTVANIVPTVAKGVTDWIFAPSRSTTINTPYIPGILASGRSLPVPQSDYTLNINNPEQSINRYPTGTGFYNPETKEYIPSSKIILSPGGVSKKTPGELAYEAANFGQWFVPGLQEGLIGIYGLKGAGDIAKGVSMSSIPNTTELERSLSRSLPADLKNTVPGSTEGQFFGLVPQTQTKAQLIEQGLFEIAPAATYGLVKAGEVGLPKFDKLFQPELTAAYDKPFADFSIELLSQNPRSALYGVERYDPLLIATKSERGFVPKVSTPLRDFFGLKPLEGKAAVEYLAKRIDMPKVEATNLAKEAMARKFGKVYLSQTGDVVGYKPGEIDLLKGDVKGFQPGKIEVGESTSKFSGVQIVRKVKPSEAANLFNKYVDAYEKQFGPINIRYNLPEGSDVGYRGKMIKSDEAFISRIPENIGKDINKIKLQRALAEDKTLGVPVSDKNLNQFAEDPTYGSTMSSGTTRGKPSQSISQFASKVSEPKPLSVFVNKMKIEISPTGEARGIKAVVEKEVPFTSTTVSERQSSMIDLMGKKVRVSRTTIISPEGRAPLEINGLPGNLDITGRPKLPTIKSEPEPWTDEKGMALKKDLESVYGKPSQVQKQVGKYYDKALKMDIPTGLPEAPTPRIKVQGPATSLANDFALAEIPKMVGGTGEFGSSYSGRGAYEVTSGTAFNLPKVKESSIGIDNFTTSTGVGQTQVPTQQDKQVDKFLFLQPTTQQNLQQELTLNIPMERVNQQNLQNQQQQQTQQTQQQQQQQQNQQAAQAQRFIRENTPRPKPDTGIKPFRFGNNQPSKSSRSKGTSSPGKYITELRRFGKFKSIATTSNPSQAVAIGKSAARGTLGASFRVRTPKGYLPLAPSEEFRMAKRSPNILVQRKVTRLSSFGEQREAKSARLNSFKMPKFKLGRGFK